MTLTKLILWMHGDIRDRLSEMERIARTGGIGETVELKREAYSLIEVLQAHEWIEESVLLETLRERQFEAPAPAGDKNSADHDAVREKLLELGEALSHPEASLTLLLVVKGFIALLRQHMAEEERGILALAEERLPPELLEELGAEALANLQRENLPLGALPPASAL